MDERMERKKRRILLLEGRESEEEEEGTKGNARATVFADLAPFWICITRPSSDRLWSPPSLSAQRWNGVRYSWPGDSFVMVISPLYILMPRKEIMRKHKGERDGDGEGRQSSAAPFSFSPTSSLRDFGSFENINCFTTSFLNQKLIIVIIKIYLSSQERIDLQNWRKDICIFYIYIYILRVILYFT